MHIGTLTMAFLALTLGQAPNDVFITNQRSHKVPLSDIPPATRQMLREFRLFVSTDQGRSWQQVDAIPADRSEFNFQSPRDGSYWFRVAVMTLQNKQEPENLYQGAPDQKMVVDTVKPIIEMSARRQGDEILATWSIQEDHPDMRALKLEYRLKDGPPNSWYVAPFDGNLVGKTQFRVNQNGSVILRLQARDLAGNASYRDVEVSGIALAAGGLPPGGVSSSSNYPQPQPSIADPGFPPSAPISPPPTMEPPPDYTPRTPIANNHNQGGPPSRVPGMPDDDLSSRKPLASNVPPPATPMDTAAPQPKQPNMPQTRYLNSTNLTFEYEISKLSPSGIGVVEVYWTLNDGNRWELFADDPKSGPSMLPGRYKRRLELPGDGVYGFTCVALSRAAKEMKDKAGVHPGNKPKDGDAPEIRVEVDTIPPVVELFAPVPDKQRENTMILTWTAKDKNLSAEPISLEWAENPQGPWQACGAKQSNVGRFSWTLPPRIPVQVYLRVKATDFAGNEGVAVTQEPLYVDLGQPQARFTDVTVTQQAP